LKDKKGNKPKNPEINKLRLESKDLTSIINVIKDQITNGNKDDVTIVANINIENNNTPELESNHYDSINLLENDIDLLIEYIINHLHTFTNNQIKKLKQGLFLWSNTQQKIKLQQLEHDHIKLSKREKEILTEICNGLSNNQIAKKKFISRRTVDTHRTNLLSKTNCKNTAQLVVWAIKNNLYDLP
jgi:DNA-binding CsgD family transcriptional regulator